VKIHKHEKSTIVAICDKELVGKTFSEGKRKLDLKTYADFYKGKQVSEKEAEDAIVSFGQGCEGEPLMQWRLLERSILKLREKTDRGTINLNTNGSFPDRVTKLCDAGLDSVRVTLNSLIGDITLVTINRKDIPLEK
jgi:MoaA/NifB/PqqE/SkfB family radical SAM enzyme